MNKQELIKKLKKNTTTVSQLSSEGFGFYDSLKLGETIKLVEQLDEPQKVKVPAGIGYHISKRKIDGDNFHESILATNWQIYEWYMENAELYEQAWVNGYEVEEEPKYRLELPHISKMTHGYATKIHNVSTGVTKDLAYDIFSEQEIKDIDERYWAFAVPIDNGFGGITCKKS